jgi:hypothetical protein
MKSKTNFFYYFGIFLVLILGVAACAQATEAPDQEMPTEEAQTGQPVSTPTQESRPEPGNTPTSTPDADPRSQLGSSAWGAVFDDGTQTWYQFDNDVAKSEVRDGKLVLTAKKNNSFDSWTMSYPPMSDFYLEVGFNPRDFCEGKDRYGILFRAPDNTQGYLYNVACDGSFQLRTWNGEQFTDLINWRVDEHIATGAELNQRLGVWAEGDQISLYVNGFQVGEVRDSAFDQGTFGVNIAAAETAGLTVDVIEAKAWELP